MNKLFKCSLILCLTLPFLSVNAQDNKTSLRDEANTDAPSISKNISMRIYGGPSLDYMLEGEGSVMKGGRFSANAGFEVNKNFSKRMYGILGVGITSGGYERWIKDPTTLSKSAYHQLTALEIPIGLGMNFGENIPKGFFVNFSVINSIALRSVSNITTIPFGSFEASTNKTNDNFDRYNVGGKLEFGVKAKFQGNSYASFSLAPKVMLYNRFSTNTNQFTGLSIAALMGFYF